MNDYQEFLSAEFFPPIQTKTLRKFQNLLTADVNDKGVLDIDTVKGCTAGMNARPDGGCYNACYAANISKFRGIDFTVAVTRTVQSKAQRDFIEKAVINSPRGFFRIGTMGDPCHAWEHTVNVIEWLSKFARPVIITKHWMKATDEQFERLIKCRTVLNTSISALDTPSELAYRVKQFNRYKYLGGESVARIVSCDFNREHPEGYTKGLIQDELFELRPMLDNPLRVARTHRLAKDGIIHLTKIKDLASERTISLANSNAYIGHCEGCPDLCGVTMFEEYNNFPANPKLHQINLFN